MVTRVPVLIAPAGVRLPVVSGPARPRRARWACTALVLIIAAVGKPEMIRGEWILSLIHISEPTRPY